MQAATVRAISKRVKCPGPARQGVRNDAAPISMMGQMNARRLSV